MKTKTNLKKLAHLGLQQRKMDKKISNLSAKVLGSAEIFVEEEAKKMRMKGYVLAGLMETTYNNNLAEVIAGSVVCAWREGKVFALFPEHKKLSAFLDSVGRNFSLSFKLISYEECHDLDNDFEVINLENHYHLYKGEGGEGVAHFEISPALV